MPTPIPVFLFWLTVAQVSLLLGSGFLALKWALEETRYTKPERPKLRLVK
jgi:hypothetical protein